MTKRERKYLKRNKHEIVYINGVWIIKANIPYMKEQWTRFKQKLDKAFFLGIY